VSWVMQHAPGRLPTALRIALGGVESLG
jgi:hypothetical protein